MAHAILCAMCVLLLSNENWKKPHSSQRIYTPWRGKKPSQDTDSATLRKRLFVSVAFWRKVPREVQKTNLLLHEDIDRVMHKNFK